jgi:uncharacterized membrane protein YvbJ
MFKCPKCSRRAEPQERYCAQCYTVFTSDTQEAANLRLRAKRTKGWKAPSLIFIAILGAAFVLIDERDASAEPGSFRATVGDMKRAVNRWIAESTDFRR